MQRFSDIESKVQSAYAMQTVNPVTKIMQNPNAVNAVINAHGKFYGLRSKYDGRGNLRTPLKA